MATRTNLLYVMFAALLIFMGCASNGQPSQSAKSEQDKPAQQETPAEQPMSVVVPSDWMPNSVTTTSADVTATAEPALIDMPTVIDIPAVDIYLRGPDFHYARWGVQSDGTLRFADGRHARSSEWGWTGQVTPEQAQSIEAIASQWIAERPKGDDSNGEVWEVRVQGSKGRTMFTVHGLSPSVAEMWSIFDKAGAGLTLTEAAPTPTQNLDRLFLLESAQTQVDNE